MVEVRIRITPENAEKIMQLLKELIKSDTESTVIIDTTNVPQSVVKKTQANYLSVPPALDGLPNAKTLNTRESSLVGSWGQFNSFFPIKAVLRVLAHMMHENNQEPVSLQSLVDSSVSAFKEAGLLKYRGFPKRAKKESAIGRLVWHFMGTAHGMGLIDVEGHVEIPARGWDETHVSITKEGLEFAALENRLLDRNEKEQILTDSESKWIISYLKRIDSEGYREYSFLTKIFEQIKQGNTNVAAWLEESESFNDYLKSWSSKQENPKEFKKQLWNVAVMFAQSKIALLRELGMVKNRRNDYTIMRNLE